MNLTDTHIHLYAEEFAENLDELVEEAGKLGVDRFFLPNIDDSSVEGVFELSTRFPGKCFPMMGLHPCYVTANYSQQLSAIRKQLEDHKDEIIAVGEIGLDFYWDLTFKNEQELAFKEQVKWAYEMNLPISIHSRNSTAEIINLLRELDYKGLNGVFHCFSGDINQADDIINLGFYFGIGGVVTFKNSGLESIVRDLPMSSIVLETDGPYLAPTPYRGKMNKPQYLRLIAEKIAEIKKMKVEEVARVTTENASRLFGIGH